MTDTQQQTITITVDGKQLEAKPGELLIEACERGGVYIPRFCWHKRMDPVGACRMCLVDVEGSPPIPGSQERRPQTSCTTVVRDGMVVHTQFASEQIHDAQKTILELLLINHPLDCPICDRAGECPLQDQTQDYGPNETKFLEPKRRYEKPTKISPLINLDRERCILCYRCTRFCDELSGDVLIGVMERGPEAYIFPFENEGFDSYFSGNTVQICPVGALTSREYRFNARPWDLQVVPTTCTLCSAGCSLHASVRVQDGNVARFSAAVNEETNEEWLCDRGRFGNEFISAPDRLSYPYARKGNDLVPVSWQEAFEIMEAGLKPVIEGAASGVIVGESVCDEDAYAAQKFARTTLQTSNIDSRIEGGLDADALITPGVTYERILSSDLVVLVSLDAREEVPVLFLRLRIAAEKKGLRTAIVHSREIALSEYADVRVEIQPGDEVAAAADTALNDALSKAKNPVILLGPRACAPDVVSAWRSVAERHNARITWVPRRSNSYGVLAAGAHPALKPGYQPAAQKGLDTAGMLNAAANGELQALWLVGADVLADVPDARLGHAALSKTPFVVVQDVQSTQLMNYAHLVLPAASFVERDGTVTDFEGRRQPVNAAVDPPGAARADYAILAEAARRLGRPIGCRTFADVKAELDAALAGATPPTNTATTNAPAARSQADLRLLTYRLLYDDGSRVRMTNGIRELTSDPFAEINAEDAERLGVADGDKVTVTTAHGSLTLPARTSKAIAKGAVFVPTNQPGVNVNVLTTVNDRTPSVIVEKA